LEAAIVNAESGFVGGNRPGTMIGRSLWVPNDLCAMSPVRSLLGLSRRGSRHRSFEHPERRELAGGRSNNGLGPVLIDADLMWLASEQARAMAARGRMDQEVGSPFQDRMRKAGLGGSLAVENVGAGYRTLADAFSGWRDSPSHRANMLNRSVTRMGIAAAYALRRLRRQSRLEN
jgi:uncharacterized protein YkwD